MANGKVKVHKVLMEYGDVRIFKAKGMEIPFYYLHTKDLSVDEKRLKNKIKRDLAEIMAPDDDNGIMSPEGRVRAIDRIHSLLDRVQNIPDDRKELIKNEVVKETIGYGRLESLIADENLEEVMVSGSGLPVFVVHREYGTCSTNVRFESDEEIMSLMDNICIRIGKEINFRNPLLDAQLSDKSRINMAIPPVALDGPSITIRKFMADPLNMIDLIRFGMIPVDLAAFLWVCVDGLHVRPANILIGGGTASGKTTLLNSLMSFVPEDERVITIEDTEELHTSHLNRARLETYSVGIPGRGDRAIEVTMDMLMKNALRMRPDRIMVGEMRGEEARTLFVAMNSGHDGCMGTIHANTVEDMIIRLTHPPLDVPEPMLAGLDLMIMMRRVFIKKGIERRITEISEIDYRDGKVAVKEIANWEVEGDSMNLRLEQSEILKTIRESLSSMDFDFDDIMNKRKKILKKLSEKGVGTQELYDIVRRHRIQTTPLINHE